eukprot:g6404.t1
MAATINIGAENSGDAYYRYKMPKPISKIEGRGNGIKTNVVNNVDIAKALARPPEYILKFLGCELGAQTNFDAKTGTSIVNGAFDAHVLLTHMEAFIKKYVQCYHCGNPETVISIKKENIFLKCKACGHVSAVDMRHKLNNFILKNPPKSKLSKEEKQIRKQEKERLKAPKAEKEKVKKEKSIKKKGSKAVSTDEITTGGEKDTDDEKPNDTDATTSETLTTEQKSAEHTEEEGGDVVWHSDVTPEAIAKRAQEQLTSSAVASMVTQGNIELEASEAKKKLKKILTKLEVQDEVISAISELGSRIFKEESEEETVEFLTQILPKASTRMLVLYTVLFWEASEKLGAIVKGKSALLKCFSTSPKDQISQLLGLEFVLSMLVPEKMKESPQILNVLYNEDIIEEEVIIGWFSRPDAGQSLGISKDGAKALRNHCQPFIEYLQEEEEEEEDSEDDESEEED